MKPAVGLYLFSFYDAHFSPVPNARSHCWIQILYW